MIITILEISFCHSRHIVISMRVTNFHQLWLSSFDKIELFSVAPSKPIKEKISHVSNLHFINSLVIDVI